jgi:predicted nucleic acid-binding protein
MIVVDTSVWIAAFRGDAAVGALLSAMLDEDRVALVAPVRLELLIGARVAERAKLHRVLAALPCYVPTDGTWSRAEDIVRQAATRGHRFGAMDLLIAVLAAEHDAKLWSLDGDFARMATLGVVDLFAPSR